jgi:hypothetical protein
MKEGRTAHASGIAMTRALNARHAGNGKQMSRQALRQPFGYCCKVRQSSAKHQQIRVDNR